MDLRARNYKVYKHTNKINGKIYIGTTKIELKYRWNNGKGYKTNEEFTYDINKYGWSNFEHEVLFDNLTKEEAEWLEKMYIALYDTTNEEKGYNQSFGGRGGSNGVKYTEEEIKRRNENKGKKVICIDTGKIYNSLTDVIGDVGGYVSGLSVAIKNNKEYKGFTFKLYEKK